MYFSIWYIKNLHRKQANEMRYCGKHHWLKLTKDHSCIYTSAPGWVTDYTDLEQQSKEMLQRNVNLVESKLMHMFNDTHTSLPHLQNINATQNSCFLTLRHFVYGFTCYKLIFRIKSTWECAQVFAGSSNDTKEAGLSQEAAPSNLRRSLAINFTYNPDLWI